MTGQNLSSVKIAKMNIICWSVLLLSRNGGDRLKGIAGEEELIFHPATSFTLLRVHDNLV